MDTSINADNVNFAIIALKHNAEKADLTTICNWFSDIYYYNMIFLAISFIIFIVGLEKAPKKLTYTAVFWMVSVGVSILTTIIFGAVCHQTLPRSAVLRYFN